ncbi:hypothetical protein CCH79_00017360, partial [Gambusia affinis]
VTLRPVVPQTQTEHVEYSVAAERRRVRMLHGDIIKELLFSGSVEEGGCDARRRRARSVEVLFERVSLYQLTALQCVAGWQQRRPGWRVLNWFCLHMQTTRLFMYFCFSSCKGKNGNICHVKVETSLTVIHLYSGEYIWRTDNGLDGERGNNCCQVLDDLKEEDEEEEEDEEGSVNPTEVKMSQIVMPCHCNHRQELSVGQLLKWMDSTACLSAERHAGSLCVTASMDDIHFEHTISMGQVVNIRAKVNRAFNTSMEVGIHVSCEDLFSDRHWRVCHSYATFVTQRTNTGQKKKMCFRKYIISRKQSEGPLSVPWDPRNQVYLSYNNVSALKMLAARKNWRLSTEKDKVRLYTLEQKSMLSFRVEAEVDVPAHRAFCLLAELSSRTSWDMHYKKCELIHSVDDDDFIYRVVTPSVHQAAGGSPTSTNRGEGVLQDFILLASRRKPCGHGDPYVIALRSVSLATHPPFEGYNRGEVLCAGFTILETNNNMSLISYYNQASPEVLPYISTDIAGLSSSFYHTFCSCSQYLSRNRQPTSSEEANTNSPTYLLSGVMHSTPL